MADNFFKRFGKIPFWDRLSTLVLSSAFPNLRNVFEENTASVT
jgi:hypothetical protein